LPAYLRQHSKAAVLIWVAFLLGLLGADLWFTTRQSPVLPIAAVELGPVPLPLVAGQEPRDRALPPAPYPGMVQQTTEGKLPTLAADGTPPYRAYAYPFDRSDARPRITIVVTDVGLQASLLENAVRKLPGSVALAFNAYAPNLDQQLANARQAGHETMLVVPADGLDPASYDPGPGAMRNALTADENMQRLRLIMGRGFGYIGLLLDPRTAVLATPNLAGALLTEGQARGLALLSGNPEFTKMGLAQGSPAVDITLSLDRSLDPAAVDAALAELEQRARESGHVVAITALYPFMTDKLANWLPTLSQKGLALAPLSAVVPEPPASADEPPPSAPHQE
jgi:polysaccharide deacetylase 2 family uncharacterized protein YibQ